MLISVILIKKACIRICRTSKWIWQGSRWEALQVDKKLLSVKKLLVQVCLSTLKVLYVTEKLMSCRFGIYSDLTSLIVSSCCQLAISSKKCVFHEKMLKCWKLYEKIMFLLWKWIRKKQEYEVLGNYIRKNAMFINFP